MNHGDTLEATRVETSERGSCLLPTPFNSHYCTISCDSQDVSGEAEYNEKSSIYIQLVFEIVGRHLWRFLSTNELIRGFWDAYLRCVLAYPVCVSHYTSYDARNIDHRQPYRAGMIQCDISESNMMLGNELISFLVGF